MIQTIDSHVHSMKLSCLLHREAIWQTSTLPVQSHSQRKSHRVSYKDRISRPLLSKRERETLAVTWRPTHNWSPKSTCIVCIHCRLYKTYIEGCWNYWRQWLNKTYLLYRCTMYSLICCESSGFQTGFSGELLKHVRVFIYYYLQYKLHSYAFDGFTQWQLIITQQY